MILTIAAVAVGIDLVIEGLRYVARKTKNKYDDRVVEFVAGHKEEVVGFVGDKLGAGKSPVKPVPREKVIDHRGVK